MLKLIKVKDPFYIHSFLLSHYDPKNACVIVPDIKSKQNLESDLLEKHGFLPGVCVVRAKEFYKELFCTMDTDWVLQSDAFVREQFFAFLESYKKIKNLHNSKTVFRFFNMFLPLFFDLGNKEIFEEWFTQKKAILKPWFNLCQEFFNTLKAKKTLHESGIKALLFHYLQDGKTFGFAKKNLFVNLGFSFDFCEKEIFESLGKKKDVYVLAPELKVYDFFEKSLCDVYEKLQEEIGKKDILFLKKSSIGGEKKESVVGLSPLASPFLSAKDVEFSELRTKLFSVQSETKMQEIRYALLQVCKWIKQGVALHDISLFAPNMEEYWFALNVYFKKHGIALNKSVVGKILDFPDVRYFLSAVRLHLGLRRFEDLEYFCFYKEHVKREFSFFRKCYFNVPERDLSLFFLKQEKVLSASKNISGFDFVSWALSFWPKKAGAELWDAVSKVFLKLSKEDVLPASRWLGLLEEEFSGLEIPIEEEENTGIQALSLNALHSSNSPYVFVMGMSEEDLKTPDLSLIGEADKKNVLQDLGFPLVSSALHQTRDSVLWFLQSSNTKECFFSFSYFDFKGDVATPSLLYFLAESVFGAKKNIFLDKPLWDFARSQQSIDDVLRKSSIEKTVAKALKTGFLKTKTRQVFFQREKLSLSPNRLKLYRDCPFKYAAEKLFCIKQETAVERELSPLVKGTKVHDLFYYMLDRYLDCTPTESQIDELLEDVKPDKEELIYSKQWQIVKQELKNLLQVFLKKEQNARVKFLGLKPKSFEVECDTYWDQKKARLSKTGDYQFKARIDRVDEHKDFYVIRDYKSSKYGLTNIESWIKEKGELQLTFYAQAVAYGLIDELPAKPVKALFYSVYKDDFLSKGFEDKNLIYPVMDKGRGHKKEAEVLKQAIAVANRQTKAFVERMEKGEFSPKPENKDICEKCSYQTWCRVETLK